MPRPRRGRRPSEPQEHLADNGFRWKSSYPERTQAPIGSRKPKVRIDYGPRDDAPVAPEIGLEAPSGSLYVPVAVARMLDASDAAEPESRAELLWRVREASDACAWARIIDMASRREYALGEAAERLKLDGYSESCIERTLAKAVEKRVISEVRFADSFIRAKLASGWGSLRIERELARRGVDPASVSGWPDEYLADETPLDRASAALAAKRVPAANAYPKLVRFLVTRGYPFSVATQAVKMRLASSGIDEEGGST